MKLFESTWSQNIPEVLPIVPTIDVVTFPHMIIPLLIVDEKIIAGIQQAMNSGNKLVLVVACKKQGNITNSIGSEDLFSVGTVSNIIRVIPLPEGGIKVLIQGIVRASITNITIDDILMASVNPIKYNDELDSSESIQEKILFIKKLVENLNETGSISEDFHSLLSKMTQPDKIADFILSHLTLSINELQKLLEVKSYIEFFEISAGLLIREAEITKINQNIKNKARESISNAQKEFYIREQIRALKEEIGDEEENIDDFIQKLQNIKDFISKEAYKEIHRSINRLEGMPSESAEAGVLKSYLECIFDLPWNLETIDNDNLLNAKEILDKEHYGLSHAKDRILDFLSIRILCKKKSSTIICFHGPPGVGKTSLAQSIANALGRNFFRISVGGMKDEAEIRGHRRTYVGAIPGRFIKGIRQAQSNNPVIIIDEIDKMGAEFKGDPASAMLEVLDYEQNHSFHDYYLGIPFDLSKCFFICTANNIQNIPHPLLDRMELIELSSYTFDEKLNIASKYLLKKALLETGLIEKGLEISDEILGEIINSYTYEAGVRDLDRWIKKLVSRIARIYLETGFLEKITKENLEKYLGCPRYIGSKQHEIDKVGVSCGLCWTAYGGEIIHIETVLTSGNGKLILTGQLGDIMKESAHTAMSYIKSNYLKYGIDEKIFSNFDIHVHVPAGGIPKDGPSAGCAILISLLSAITKKPINCKYAMTGEIDLQGHVLPVGGIKEKVLAAKKNLINNVILPFNNKYDVSDNKDYFDNINIIYASDINEIIDILLEFNNIKNEEKEERVESLSDIVEGALEIIEENILPENEICI